MSLTEQQAERISAQCRNGRECVVRYFQGQPILEWFGDSAAAGEAYRRQPRAELFRHGFWVATRDYTTHFWDGAGI
ncbi:hypothetical protein [Botrimarina sp.]|uniref:hypothetical protein n=1 Tax=Botrimarina sp. TaxID=2795802 RepID=UPI0032EC7A5E